MYGLALVTKPQAILFAPVLAFALLALRYRPGGRGELVAAGLRAVPAAASSWPPSRRRSCCTTRGAAPGRGAGSSASYLGTIGSDEYAYTTLNAFNLWWLDLVAQRPSADDWWRLLDSRALAADRAVEGRDGRLLLVLALGAAAVACARRRRWGDGRA